MCGTKVIRRLGEVPSVTVQLAYPLRSHTHLSYPHHPTLPNLSINNLRLFSIKCMSNCIVVDRLGISMSRHSIYL